MSTAENAASTIEKLAKKTGLLKNAKNIKVVGRYFDASPNDNFDRGQLQIEVQKVDKEGNIVKLGRIRLKIDQIYLNNPNEINKKNIPFSLNT